MYVTIQRDVTFVNSFLSDYELKGTEHFM